MTITAPERTRPGPTALSRPLRLVQPDLEGAWPPRYVRPQRSATSPTSPTSLASSTTPPAPAARSVRITRRGRLVLTLAAVATLSGLGLSAATAQAAAPGAIPAAAGSAVVQPGDTLWAVAVRADPAADPRVTIGRIVKLNGLPDSTVRPGQRLRLSRP